MEGQKLKVATKTMSVIETATVVMFNQRAEPNQIKNRRLGVVFSV